MKKAILPFHSDFYTKNRERLAKSLTDNSVLVLYSGEHYVSSYDQNFLFRVDSDFFYLTGIEEPDIYLVIYKSDSGEISEYIFVHPVDDLEQTWNGEMLTFINATKISGIQNVQSRENLDKLVFRMLAGVDNFYVCYNDAQHIQAINSYHRFVENLKLRLPGTAIKKAMPLIRKQRLTKNNFELKAIEKAISLTDKALRNVLKKLKPGIFEYQIEAELTYAYQSAGCQHGFEPIVAAGKNACFLHYNENKAKIGKGELVLIDTGCNYGMYNSDITRVFPVSGKFSVRQKFLYEVNLEIMEEVLSFIKAGLTPNEIFTEAGNIQGRVLKKHKLISDTNAHSKLTIHRIGHPVGIDVHDPVSNQIPHPVGSIITIEPGLYLPEESIGIRIEDNVVLTENGHINLSSFIPKTVKEIESAMASA